MIPFSVLDLSPIVEGSDASRALANSLDLAQHAERWGYQRFWMAEHHNMPGVASAATSVCLAYVGQGTKTIRVGAGGIMLPNHAPIVIAEQFGTLAALFPGRVDLGIGRAPGTDQVTAHALRRTLNGNIDEFPQDVLEVMAYFRAPEPGQLVTAVPAAGADVPVWILGSSLYGAQLAAALGLPFSFASHFAPAQMMEAVRLYRSGFRPSERLAKPYVMLGVNVIAADSDEEAAFLASSGVQSFIRMRTGRPGLLPPPREGAEADLTPMLRAMLEERRRFAVTGGPETVRRTLRTFIEQTGADEFIAASQVYEHSARLRSYELIAQARDDLRKSVAA